MITLSAINVFSIIFLAIIDSTVYYKPEFFVLVDFSHYFVALIYTGGVLALYTTSTAFHLCPNFRNLTETEGEGTDATYDQSQYDIKGNTWTRDSEMPPNVRVSVNPTRLPNGQVFELGSRERMQSIVDVDLGIGYHEDK